jgi:hypothetical protein
MFFEFLKIELRFDDDLLDFFSKHMIWKNEKKNMTNI